uniref:DUF7745 domain-containing protein n=1 Tax=Fagus sylvatica TaxID=28930 RepID=A0A2N9GQI2_FAGSY
MASSSDNPDSLVTLRFHDFRIERMRHWWTLLGEDDHVSIVGVFGKFASLMWLRVDHGLLDALVSFWDPTHYCFSVGEVDLIPTLEEYAGLLQLDSPFQRDACHTHSESSVKLSLGEVLGFDFRGLASRDHPSGRDLAESQPSSGSADEETGRGGPDVLHTAPPALVLQPLAVFLPPPRLPYHFERHTVRQTVNTALPFTGNSRDWALYLLDLPLSEWSWRVAWGPAATIPAFALRQFGGVQYPPRLGDLSAVTFDYVPGLPYGQVHHILRCLVLFGLQLLLVSPKRVAVLERELEEARAELSSLRLARASEREESATRVESMRSTLHHSNAAVANLRRDLELEISEAAKDHMEQTLAETQGQLETEQVERTRVQDELDSLRSYTQALWLIPPQAEVDLVHDALESNASWLNREGFPVVTALHQVN